MRIPEDMAMRMLRYRAKHNIGQDELARRCNVTTQTIGNIENGRRDGITALTATKIEQVITDDYSE